MENSEISWCDHTWNLARGCTKVDADCLYCYMMRDGDRYKYDGKTVQRTKSVFNMPLKIKEGKSKVWDGPQLVFTSSLTDVMHKDIDSFRHEMWAIIRQRPDLIFQILTKRTERLAECLPPDWGEGYPNVWLGTSVGSQKSDHRISELIRTPAHRRFLSLEPLHGPIDITNHGIRNGYSIPTRYDERGVGIEWTDPGPDFIGVHWVIVGGESGNENGKWRYRPCEEGWITNIVQACSRSQTPVFVKQLGTHLSKELGLKDRHGRNINEWPYQLQVREMPKI